MINEVENGLLKLDIIANYTMNIYNTNSIQELRKLGINQFTISPELNKDAILNLCNKSQSNVIILNRNQ